MASMLRVRVVGTGWTGAPGLNTFYFGITATPDAGDLQDVYDRVRGFFTGVAAIFENDTTWTVDTAVDELDPATGVLIGSATVGTPGAAVVGTGTDGLAPTSSMCTLALGTNTFIAGRRLRGRAFLGPLNKGAIVNGSFSSSAIAIVDGVAPDLSDTSNGAAVNVVWHRPVGGTGGSVGDVTAWQSRSALGVLRSRRD
jgi:hypothetical protein